MSSASTLSTVRAGHHRVHAAGVVADHAAQRAVIVGGGVRAEGEVVRLGRVAQGRRARSPAAPARGRSRGVDLQHAVQVLREVDHHGDVAALAGQAGAAAARQDRRAVLAAQRDGGDRRRPRRAGAPRRSAPAGSSTRRWRKARGCRRRSAPRRRSWARRSAASASTSTWVGTGCWRRARSAGVRIGTTSVLAITSPLVRNPVFDHVAVALANHGRASPGRPRRIANQNALACLKRDVRRQRRHVGIGDRLEHHGPVGAKASSQAGPICSGRSTRIPCRPSDLGVARRRGSPAGPARPRTSGRRPSRAAPRSPG